MTEVLCESYFRAVHPQWRGLIKSALLEMERSYLEALAYNTDWLPGKHALFNAFSLPLDKTRYILFGESPYPRALSANGYAFWDAAVTDLWGVKGLSCSVNRATSLRNLMKMLLYAEGKLQQDFSQEAIRILDKTAYYQTANEMFKGLVARGFLLLNATLVFEKGKVNYHAKMWRPFLYKLLEGIAAHSQSISLLLFGKIAEQIPQQQYFQCLIAEHPYNLSFITNPRVVHFFKPLQLLRLTYE